MSRSTLILVLCAGCAGHSSAPSNPAPEDAAPEESTPPRLRPDGAAAPDGGPAVDAASSPEGDVPSAPPADVPPMPPAAGECAKLFGGGAVTR
jgi:hypothetical protein